MVLQVLYRTAQGTSRCPRDCHLHERDHFVLGHQLNPRHHSKGLEVTFVHEQQVSSATAYLPNFLSERAQVRPSPEWIIRKSSAQPQERKCHGHQNYQGQDRPWRDRALRRHWRPPHAHFPLGYTPRAAPIERDRRPCYAGRRRPRSWCSPLTPPQGAPQAVRQVRLGAASESRREVLVLSR